MISLAFVYEWIFINFLCYFIGSILVPFFFSKNYKLEDVKYDRQLIDRKSEFVRKTRFSYEYRGQNFYQWEFVVLIGFIFWSTVGIVSYIIYRIAQPVA